METQQPTKPLKLGQAGFQQMELPVPPGFALICCLLQKEVADVLVDFMRSAAADTPLCGERHGPAKAYFTACGYHRGQFTTAELEAALLELQSISLLWPSGADGEFMEMHTRWCKQYHRWWTKKWKARRRKPIPNIQQTTT